MTIEELFDKENTNISDYYSKAHDWYNFHNKNLNSIKGLPEDFNYRMGISFNNIDNLEGLPKMFNSEIIIYNTNIKSLDGLNDVLNPKNFIGLRWGFIVSEYKRLGKHHLLI